MYIHTLYSSVTAGNSHGDNMIIHHLFPSLKLVIVPVVVRRRKYILLYPNHEAGDEEEKGRIQTRKVSSRRIVTISRPTVQA